MQASRLRRALDKYYLTQGAEDPIRVELPKGGYVPVFFDNSATLVAPGASTSPAPVAAGTPLDSSDPTIAVFMFENLNKADETSYLATGLTNEILIALTKFTPLQVKGPLVQAEDRATGSAIDLEKIHRDYGASFALQAWVRGQGSRIRISVDLTDASTGSKQWGRTFEYDLEESSLFDIEDEVTSQVAGVVADGLGIIIISSCKMPFLAG